MSFACPSITITYNLQKGKGKGKGIVNFWEKGKGIIIIIFLSPSIKGKLKTEVLEDISSMCVSAPPHNGFCIVN